MITAFDTLIGKALPKIVTIFSHEPKTLSMDSDKMGSDMGTPMTSEINEAPDNDFVTMVDSQVADIASQLGASNETVETVEMGSDMATPRTSEINEAPDNDFVTMVDSQVADIASQLGASNETVETFGGVMDSAEMGSGMATPRTSELIELSVNEAMGKCNEAPAPDGALVNELHSRVVDLASQLGASLSVETDETVETFGGVSQGTEEAENSISGMPEPALFVGDAAPMNAPVEVPVVQPAPVYGTPCFPSRPPKFGRCTNRLWPVSGPSRRWT
jgi:hypothetical protein